MKIAQIAPLVESVPPALYGGTERIASYLTEELVRLGHDVTLFASGDSRTAATLVPVVPRALRLDPTPPDPLASHLLLVDEVARRAADFDVLHFHIDLVHFPLFRRLAARTLTTLHGRLDLPGLAPFYRAFREMPVVSISDDQRRPLAHANWVATVPHGLPGQLMSYNAKPCGEYLAFLGRVSPEKRPDRAIAIAKRAGMKLALAAKVDREDREYFEREIRPLLGHPLVEWIGEIGDADKQAFLGNAAALLFPIDWDEPFGLVMIESMACGTPVIAWRRGSVPEVVDHGVSGLVVDDEDAAVNAVRTLGRIDRARVRAAFERRFTAERMAADYLRAYASIGAASAPARAVEASGAGA